MRRLFPALTHLLGGYFWQAWPDFYPDEWHVLDEYLRKSWDGGQGLVDDIERLLESHDEDWVTDYLITECGYSFGEEEPGGNRAWLAEVARRADLGPDDAFLPPPSFKVGRRLAATVVRQHRVTVRRWRATGEGRLVLDRVFPKPIGWTREGGVERQVHGVRVVLVRDPERFKGYRVVTAQAQPVRERRTDLPAFRHLADAYFYCNWRQDFKHASATAAFAMESPRMATQLLDEITQLRGRTEDEIGLFLEDIGPQVAQQLPHETWHGWLDLMEENVRGILAMRSR